MFDPMDKPLASPGSEWWPVGTRVRKIRGAAMGGAIPR